MNAQLDIASLLQWSEPETVNTRRGERLLRKATPTGEFWQAWRNDQAALKAAGISVGKQNGDWEVCWWSEPVRDPQGAVERLNGRPVKQTISGQDAGSGAVEVRSNSSHRAGPDVSVVKEAAESIFGGGRRAAAREVAFLEETPAPVTSSSLPSGIILSDEQLAIVRHFEVGTENFVVDAKAGTGKTFTIVVGISSVRGENTVIYYLVFNRKNKLEAQGKITDPRVTVTTLNACGYRFCKSVWPGCKPDDAVEGDRIRAVCPNIPDEAVTAVERLVGFGKNLFIGVPSVGDLNATAIERGVFCGLQDDEGQDEFPVSRLASIAQAAMQYALDVKDSAGRISFNDQCWLAVSKGWVRPISDFTVVDETQDMNVVQLAMARRMTRKTGRVGVVGDPRQCIYTFRGAHPDGMAMMQRELNAKVYGLTITRRCPKAVVRHVNPIVPTYRSADDAPEGLVSRCDQGELYEKLVVGDVVISRANAPLMPICLGLLRKGVPARIEGRDIGKQLIGMVKKLNARSVPDFLRRLHHWGDKQKARLNVGKLGAAKCAVVDDQVQTLEALAEGCANVNEIEARIKTLFQDSDEEGVKPAVVLSSTHKAKGLEWDRVALLSWTYNRSRKNMTDEQRREEENIYYVACTRAKRELWLVSEGGSVKVKENADGTKEVAA